MNTICVFGDSITYGNSDAESEGWVSRLKTFIEKNTAKEWFNIYNLGIPGDTTKGLLKRFETEAESRMPDLIIFAIGINDSAYRVSPDNNETQKKEFGANLQTLTKGARKFTDNIVFVGLTKVEEFKVQPLDSSTTGKSYSNALIQEYDDIIKLFCEREDVSFIEIFDLLENKDLDDGLHPNAKGHQKIFEKVRDFLMNNKVL